MGDSADTAREKLALKRKTKPPAKVPGLFGDRPADRPKQKPFVPPQPTFHIETPAQTRAYRSSMGPSHRDAPEPRRNRQYEKGNIDLQHRPHVKNPDGSVSTVRSISFDPGDGREILIPTVVGNRVVSDDEAIANYHRTGQHLGIYSDPETANRAGDQIHEDQAAMGEKHGGFLGGLLGRAKDVAAKPFQYDHFAKNWAAGLDATPHAISHNTTDFLKWYSASKGDNGPFSRLAQVAYKGASGEDTRAMFDPRVAIGAVLLDGLNLAAGPETQQFMMEHFGKGQYHGKNGNDWMAGLEMVTAFPALRAARGVFEGARVLGKGGMVSKAVLHANDIYAHDQPIVNTVRAVGRAVGKNGTKQRIFQVNDLKVAVGAAEGRAGRAAENVIDATRTNKGIEKRVGREIRERNLTRQRVYERGLPPLRRAITKLARGKNGDAETYALRLALEKRDPSKAAGFHLGHALGDNVDPQEAINHGIHSNLATAASHFVQVTPEGVQFSQDSSPALREAYRLITDVTSQTRESFLKQLGLVTDDQIRQRAESPARVMEGAAWQPYEQIFEEALAANPNRRDFQQGLIEDGSTPQEAAAVVEAIDRINRAFVQADPTISPQKIVDGTNELWSKMKLHVHEGDQIAPENLPPQETLTHQSDVPEDVPGETDMSAFEQAPEAPVEGKAAISDLYGPGAKHLEDAISNAPEGQSLVDDVKENIDNLQGHVEDAVIHQLHSLVDQGEYEEAWQVTRQAWMNTDGIGDPAAPYIRSVRHSLDDLILDGIENGDVQKIVPEAPSTNMTDFEFALPPDAHIMTANEATNGLADPDFVYHGTDAARAEQILAERRLKSNGEYAYLTSNPRLAATYARYTADKTGDEAAARVIAIPKSALPSNVRSAEKGGEEFGGTIYRSQDDVLFNRAIGKILGAAEFGPDGEFTLHKAEDADMHTIVHEVGHLLRRRLTPAQEKSIAKLSGAKKMADGSFIWGLGAEEKFADMFVAAIQGKSVGSNAMRVPPAMKKYAKVMRKAMKEAVNKQPVMPLTPKAARAFDKMLDYKTLKGGRFVGAEDFFADSNLIPIYVDYTRGIPTPSNESAIGRAMGRYAGLFQGGKQAIGRGPIDPKAEKVFKAQLLASGMFENSMNASVSSVVIASRMMAASKIRKEFLAAASDIPQSTRDQAIKVDPSVNANPELKKLYDVMGGLDEDMTLDPDRLADLNLDAALGMMEDLFPGELQGMNAQEVAAHILETQEPIDNIKWVPWHVVHTSEALRAPSKGLFEPSKGGLDKAGHIALVSAKYANDIGRAMLTTLNPAYIPMNLTGNLTMNLIHQGWHAPRNIAKAAMLHRQMAPEDRVLLDTLMGTGFAENIGFQQIDSLKTFSHYVGLAVDLIPRRAAILRELEKEGYDSPAKISALLQRTDDEGVAVIKGISSKAKSAMVDFDKMSATEKKVGQWILFYPWIRGATAYTGKLAMDHPLVFSALIMLHDNAQAQAQQELGKRPGYAKETYPIGTGSIGASIPFTGKRVSLANLVGEHDWKNEKGLPMTINIRQAFPQTTPLELAGQLKDIMSGKVSILESLPPLMQALITTASGYDPFYEKEVPRSFGTFFDQLLGGAPGPAAIKRTFLQSDKDRAEANESRISPRSKTNDAFRIGGGSLTPAPYSPEAGQRAAAKKGGDETGVSAIDLAKDAKAVGLLAPDKTILEDLDWYTKLTTEASGKTDEEKARLAEKLFIDRFPDSDMEGYVDSLPETQYLWFYEQVRDRIAPDLKTYKDILSKRKSAAS